MKNLSDFQPPTAVLVIKLGKEIFYASLRQNRSAEAFLENLRQRLTLPLKNCGDFAFCGDTYFEIPAKTEKFEAKSGDIVITESRKIAIYLKTAETEGVLIARMGYNSAERFLKAFSGETVAEFSLEWSE